MKMILLFFVSLSFYFNDTLQAQGVPYNQEFQVNTYVSDWQSHPSVCSLPDSGFVICWQSSGRSISGQLFNKDRSKRGEEFQVSTYSGFSPSPKVSSLVGGAFVVCWKNNSRVLGQLYNSDGSKHGSEFEANANTSNSPYDLNVRNLSDGGFVVCWSSYADEYRGIYFQLFNNDGSKRGDEHFVSNWPSKPNVNYIGADRFVISWAEADEINNIYKIYYQIFSNNGLKLSEQIQVNAYTEPFQDSPDVCTLVDGSFVLCWYTETEDDLNLKCQILNSDGSKKGAEFFANVNDKVTHDTFGISALLNGGFVINWYATNENYGQFYKNDGIKRGFEFPLSQYSSDEFCIAGMPDSGFVVCWNTNGDIFGKYIKELKHPLISYTLIEPKNDVVTNSTIQLFKWQQASNIPINLSSELEYLLFLDEMEDFSNAQIIPPIYDTTYTIQNLTPGTTYFWKVLAKNIAGDSLWSSETFGFFVDWNATVLEDEITTNQPQHFKLYQNYPNPFNPTTKISYTVGAHQNSPLHVELAIYNLLGKKVAALVDKQQSQGEYSVNFDAGSLTSGVYMYKLKAGTFKQTRKMILLR